MAVWYAESSCVLESRIEEQHYVRYDSSVGIVWRNVDAPYGMFDNVLCGEWLG